MCSGLPYQYLWECDFLLDNSLIKVFWFGLYIGLCATMMYQMYHIEGMQVALANLSFVEQPFEVTMTLKKETYNGSQGATITAYPWSHNYHLKSSLLTSNQQSQWGNHK